MSRLAILFLLLVAPVLSFCLALLGLETSGRNILGWFLLVFGIAYPAGGVINYFIRREPFWNSAGKGMAKSEEIGDRSFWAILPGFLIVFFAPPLEEMYIQAVLPRNLWMQIAGIVLIMAAITLHVWARAHLRGQYSGHVEVQTGHTLVQSGPYRWIRHPGYAGFLLMAIGLTLGFSSLIGLAAVPCLLLPGLAYRMKIEETLLRMQFGEQFCMYALKTKRIIPFVW